MKSSPTKQSIQQYSISKRAQGEIIGLILIVILLAAGFMLYVKFGLNPANTSPKQAYETTQLGQTYVNSLAKATITCGTQSFAVDELVREIAMGTTTCDAETTLNAFINSTLQQTLNPWGINYRLVIVRKMANGEETIGLANFTNGNVTTLKRCNDPLGPNPMDRTSDTYLVSLNAGSAEIRLEQCS